MCIRDSNYCSQLLADSYRYNTHSPLPVFCAFYSRLKILNHEKVICDSIIDGDRGNGIGTNERRWTLLQGRRKVLSSAYTYNCRVGCWLLFTLLLPVLLSSL